MENGITLIRQLTANHGRFFNYEEFRHKYPGVRTNFLMYEGVISSIKTYLHKTGLECKGESYQQVQNRVLNVINKGNKAVCLLFDDPAAVPAGVSKWNDQYGAHVNTKWRNIFLQCKKTTVDTQLRWFQLRILHRIIATNKFLCACKIIDSDRCTFCKHDQETIVHLFWQCPIIRQFWTDVMMWLKSHCAHMYNLEFDEILIIFGKKQNVITDTVLDLIILLGKFYIYRCRMEGIKPIISAFIVIIKQRYTVEKYMHYITNKSLLFERCWLPYENIAKT